MANTLKNKVVWLTGATSGIGEGLAYALAEQGAKLIISARRKEELQRVAQKCKNTDVFILPLDLANQSNFEEKTNEVIHKFGRIDILINNGGISQRSLVKNTTLHVDRNIMEINYFGAVALTKAVLPHFLKQGSGMFVVTTSTVGKIGTPYRSGYSASKHALHGFFDSLRAEVHDNNIKVLLVCPGFIQTNISVNALTGTGDTLGTMDAATASGLTPKECARQIINGILSEKQEIIVGGLKEKGGIWIKRFFPSFFSVLIRKLPVR
jgi:dehydrogenase/reductase SDR family protein 7B